MKSTILILVVLFSSVGCSVGTKVNIQADQLEYPVSQSSTFYSSSGEFVNSSTYEPISEFSYSFKKWGNSLINIHSDVDISNELNQIIQSKSGDAIVDLQISMRNTGTNSFMVFVKSVALMGSIIATAVTISQPSTKNSLFAGGSIITYIFTPANIDVEISGLVVKMSE